MADTAINSQFNYIYNFADPAAALEFTLESLEKCFEAGLVVLDANVLLLPLGTGAHTLDAIERTFKKLIGEQRLYVPKHALREYLANRPTKIKELFDQLSKKREKEYKPSSSPLLQKAKCYGNLVEAEKALQEESKKVIKIIGAAMDEIKMWENNDPVTQMYKNIQLFKHVAPDPVDFNDKEQVTKLEKEHADRVLKRIPPGYKDAVKDGNDIGDFLIWKTVLELGTKNPGKHLTFVSGETKPDWVYRSANQTLYAREELIEEYRRASQGGSFHLIDFATLLRLSKASDEVVNEVRINEVISAMAEAQDPEVSMQRPKSWDSFVKLAKAALGKWLTGNFANVVEYSDENNSDFVASPGDGKVYVIEMRPIRNATFFTNRVRELSGSLLEKVSIKQRLNPADQVIGAIVFVCEDKGGAQFISENMGTYSHPEWLEIHAGYLESGEFQLVL